GLYVIVASVREDFGESRNRRMALNLLITDMVLVSRQRGDALEVIVRSGADGRRLPGVEVALYRFDYKRGHRRVASRTTDDSGSTTFRVSNQRSDSHFLVARQEGDYALDSRRMWIGGPLPSPDTSTSALIYTDRSVYRPLQKVLWKVVGYQRSPDADRFQTLPQERMTVDLLDSNGESVESVEVETNEFGTASGAFTVPAGRLLGRWSLRTSLGGWSQVTIEEYKRPTFEVTLVDPVEPVRLNRPASLSGEVRYYFGLPVVTGQVAWHVSRVPVFPRWMGWYRTYPTQVPETIASGTAELDTDGRFEISFLPAADERLAATAGLSYRYKLTAAVTDEGGETRSAERLFRLGFVAVEATVEAAKTFFTVGDRVEILLARKDLNGVGRAGSADWSLTKVEQPDSTAAPAEIPKQIAPGDEDRFRTPGDLLRPRWAADYSFESLLASWSDGEVVRRGTVEHGEDGSASVLLVDLPPDVYRLHYSTEDEFGSVFETRRDLLVVGEGLGRLELPALLLAERQSSEVGETLKVLVHSGLEDQELLLELQSSGETIEQRLLQSGAGPVVLEFPVDSSRRGGFSFLLSTLVDYQFISASQAIWVPWEDRELQLAFSSFRDLLRPGSQETWRVTVSSSDGRRLERGAAELLAYMYDRSLDLFAPHNPPSVLSLYPTRTETLSFQTSLGSAGAVWQSSPGFVVFPEYPHLHGDQLRFLDGYGIGGPGRRRGYALADMAPAALQESEVAEQSSLEEVGKVAAKSLPGEVGGSQEAGNAIELRSEFSETAFWHPHLVVEDEGAVSFEFTVPDSVTEWNVWLHALDRDLRGGSFQRQVRTVKELMVRPY
ncbi:MAG: MG2 domain-containing protein, partial [Thermoanaerobaculia bacterium]